MPGSFSVFDSLAEHLIATLAPRSALDIGCGAGKYGQMLARLAPQCRRSAIEPEASYIEQYRLNELYAEVLNCRAADWQARAQSLDAQFDLVILGDCIEHMPKSAGLDLLNFLAYRSAYILVLAPEFVVQSATGGAASEARVSVWSERDLGWHDLWAWENCRSVGLYLLRGYLPVGPALSQVVEGVNALSLPIHEFHDRQSVVRPARLRLVDHGRETSYRPA